MGAGRQSARLPRLGAVARARSPSRLLFPDAESTGRFVGVALDVPVDTLFTYRVPPAQEARARPGHRVVVPFRRGRRTGIIVEVQQTPAVERVLDVHDVPDAEPVLGEDLLTLGRFVARYYGSSLGEALAAMVPRGIRKKGSGRLRLRARLAPGAEVPEGDVPPTAPQARVLRVLAEHMEHGVLLADLCRMASVSASPVQTLARHGRITLRREREDALAAAATEPVPRQAPHDLSPEQAVAVDRVTAAVAAGTFSPFLLLGVTGSGKTEVYLQAIRACVEGGRQAIVLVPEIALTPQTVRRFRARFDRVAVLHSGMTEAARARAWQSIRDGGIDVVIGPRSAVFAPVPRLGLLVVDEEHEGTFKQQTAPRYHARDVGHRAREGRGRDRRAGYRDAGARELAPRGRGALRAAPPPRARRGPAAAHRADRRHAARRRAPAAGPAHRTHARGPHPRGAA